MIKIRRKFKYIKYKLKYKFINWFNKKVTPYGKGAFLFWGFSFIFGAYISKTLIYQIFIILTLFFIFEFLLTLYFKPKLKITRVFPKYCNVNKKLYYHIEIENIGDKVERGLYIKESLPAPFPDFEEFSNICNKKHFFKIKFYYREWKKYIRNNRKAQLKVQKIPGIHPGEKVEVELNFTPLKRGHIFFKGLNIIKRGPFSLFQKFRFYKNPGKIISLPKIYNVELPLLSKNRKYNRGGILSASEVGNSEEFLFLRDYNPGDPVKYIDWKSYSKNQKLVVKEFNDEFFSRYGLVLDTFLKNNPQILEKAVSIAASIVGGLELGDSLIDLIFICQKSYIFTGGRGLTDREKMLEILASVRRCKKERVTDLKNMVESHIDKLSSLILILVDIDESRKEFIDKLRMNTIDTKVILICEDKKEKLREIDRLGISYKINIIELKEFDRYENSKGKIRIIN